MNAAIDILPTLNGIPYFGSAKVVETNRQQNSVKVKAQIMGAERIVEARIAVQHSSPLLANVEVIIAGSDMNDMFVIGVLSCNEPLHNKGGVLQTKNGAYAALSSTTATQEETIKVYSSRNELLFEYDPVKEQAKIIVAKGNLELRTEDGDINLHSSRTVKINSQSIDMNSKRLNVKVAYAKFMFDRLETFAETLVEQAKNVYRTVIQLTQLRTGRMRTLVDETYQFKADKVFMKSEDDFKIKGEKIHLG